MTMELDIVDWFLSHGFYYLLSSNHYVLNLPDRQLYGLRKERVIVCFFQSDRNRTDVFFKDVEELELAVIYQSLRVD